MGKLNSFQASIVCSLLKAFSTIVQTIPLGGALFLGRRIGDVVGLRPKGRKKAIVNVRVAFGQERSYEEVRGIVHDFFMTYGQNIAEMGRFPLVARRGYQNFIEVDGREHMDAAMQKGKGLFFVSIHSGNWEFSNIVGSMSGYPYNMVANYLAHVNRVADYLDDLRRSAGCRIIHPGIGGREIIRRVKNNEIVTLVADQGGDEGILIPFFGPEASMSTGAVRMALKYGVPICLVDIQRVALGKHRILARPFEVRSSGDPQEDLRVNMTRMTAWFEDRTREHPQEYLWLYSTWKYSRHRRILILDDGRTGHRKQAEAVAGVVQKILADRGNTCETQILPVLYRSPWRRRLLTLLTALRIPTGVSGWGFLRFCLAPETFRSVFSKRAHVVISAGSRSAAALQAISSTEMAFSVQILRPGIVPLTRFRKVILPRHDMGRLRPSRRLIETRAALSAWTSKELEVARDQLWARRPDLRHDTRPKIGLLLGGDTKGLCWHPGKTEALLGQVLDSSRRVNAGLLVTTSRRTSKNIETLVKKTFQGVAETGLLVIPNEQDVPEAFGAILALSDLLIVSGESISMVSEAVASGKKVIAFPIEDENGRVAENKYTRFVDSLETDGHLLQARSGEMGAAIARVLQEQVPLRPLDDRQRILDALKEAVR
ncbi:MAG: hypothetical protein GX606_07410 [Elusimicrobia bacterium]|nr:hypothetical protein [Elusimicrobiota bacterium]